MKEVEGVRQWVEDLVKENTGLKKEIDTLNTDYSEEVKLNNEKMRLVIDICKLIVKVGS